MSIPRSPPSTKYFTKNISPTHYGSDSAINSSSTAEQKDVFSTNISKRKKRTNEEFSNYFSLDMDEIKSMFKDIKDQNLQKFDSIANAIETIISQNNDLKNSVSKMSSQHEELLVKIQVLEKDNADCKSRIHLLENKLENFEKIIRNNTIEIRNIPIENNESKTKQLSIIQDISLAVGMKKLIQESDIKQVYRSKNKNLVVDFVHTHIKELFISEYRKMNKSRRETNQPTINTTNINIAGPPRTLFISEYLTTKARHTFYLARQNVKLNKLVAAWTSFGYIYVKKEDGSAPIRIASEEDLNRVIL